MSILMARSELKLFPAILTASRPASSSRASDGTTMFTSPILSASSASTVLPVNSSSLARPTPTVLYSRWEEPKIGGMPSRASGKEKTASEEAMRMSAARARPRPAPVVSPFTTAMTGTGSASMCFSRL